MRLEDADALETVAVAYAQPDIALMLSLLEGEGILTLPHSHCHAGVQWPLMLALGGVQIRVPAAKAEWARAILAELDHGTARGGVYFEARMLDLLTALLLIVIAMVPPPARLPPRIVAAAGGPARD